MLRGFFATVCLAAALLLVTGCGQGGGGGGGPKLANPDDPKVKDLKVQTPGGPLGGKKGGPIPD
jgi:hypothetical protein